MQHELPTAEAACSVIRIYIRLALYVKCLRQVATCEVLALSCCSAAAGALESPQAAVQAGAAGEGGSCCSKGREGEERKALTAGTVPAVSAFF
jgi:hypothetical protein